MKYKKILLSRTDSIGDVILALPMAGVIKKAFPEVQVAFLGRTYTEPVIKRSIFIDEFYNWDELEKNLAAMVEADMIVHVFPNRKIAHWAKHIDITKRIGTSHRIYHWATCNKLINLGRKNSDLHEAQLNLQLLKWLDDFPYDISLSALPVYYGWKSPGLLSDKFTPYLSPHKFNCIFHPKSQRSAKEWPLSGYFSLAQQLPADQFHILVTGTRAEGEMMRHQCPHLFLLPHVQDVTGKFNLEDFMDLIQAADGLIACSTGPLHIAAASGIHVLGLYSSIRPIHPVRWAPVGKKAEFIEDHLSKGLKDPLLHIPVEPVLEKVTQWSKKAVHHEKNL